MREDVRMLSRAIGQFAKEHKFSYTSGARAYFGMVGAAYGEFEGFRFTLVHDEREAKKCCRIFMPVHHADGALLRAQKLCEHMLEKRLVRAAGVEDHTVWVDACRRFGQMNENELEYVMHEMTQYSRKHHLRPGCAVCGEPAAQFVGHEDVPYFACSTCRDKLDSLHGRTVERRALSSTHLLRGLAGALLFSLFGVILWCVLVGFFNKIAAVAGYVIIWGALKGYLLLGGRLTKGSSLCLLLLSVAMLVGAEYLSLVLVEMQLAAELNAAPPFVLYLQNAARALSGAVMDLVWGFAFVFAGWCVHLLGMFRKTHNSIGYTSEEIV